MLSIGQIVFVFIDDYHLYSGSGMLLMICIICLFVYMMDLLLYKVYRQGTSQFPVGRLLVGIWYYSMIISAHVPGGEE